MISTIVLFFIIIIYMVLLTLRFLKKDNYIVCAAAQGVQAALWLVIAVNSWSECSTKSKLFCIFIIGASLFSVVKMLDRKSSTGK